MEKSKRASPISGGTECRPAIARLATRLYYSRNHTKSIERERERHGAVAKREGRKRVCTAFAAGRGRQRERWDMGNGIRSPFQSETTCDKQSK